MRIMLLGLLLTGLAGCSQMPTQQHLVEQAQWGALGERDGHQGKSAKTADELAHLANQYQVVDADYEQYLSAYQQGVNVYCKEQDPYELGRQGRPYFGVCDDKDKGRFKLHWQRGRDKFLSPELPD